MVACNVREGSAYKLQHCEEEDGLLYWANLTTWTLSSSPVPVETTHTVMHHRAMLQLYAARCMYVSRAGSSLKKPTWLQEAREHRHHAGRVDQCLHSTMHVLDPAHNYRALPGRWTSGFPMATFLFNAMGRASPRPITTLLRNSWTKAQGTNVSVRRCRASVSDSGELLGPHLSLSCHRASPSAALTLSGTSATTQK